MKIIYEKHSPNFNDRKSNIDIIVIHYTGMKSEQESLEQLCNISSKVSSHFLINYSGDIFSLVEEEKRAWHAGVSFWNGENDINSSSIGIELDNPGHDYGYKPFTESQMVSLEKLISYLIKKYNIPLYNIVGHSDIAPLRKKDPGEFFEWKRLAKKNLSIWPKKILLNPFNNISIGEKSRSVLKVQKSLSEIGYKINQDAYYGDETKLVLQAFQRRFRSNKFDGCFDNITGMMIHSVNSLTNI